MQGRQSHRSVFQSSSIAQTSPSAHSGDSSRKCENHLQNVICEKKVIRQSFSANDFFRGTAFRLCSLANYGVTCHAVHKAVGVEPDPPVAVSGVKLTHYNLPGKYRSSKLSSLNILNLFADFLEFRLEIHDYESDFDKRGLVSEGVDFSHHFLNEKIEASA